MNGEQVELPAWAFDAFTVAQIAEGDHESGLTASRLWWRALLAVEVVPPSVRIVAAVLQDRMGASDRATLGVARIARASGLTEPTVRASLRLLEMNGWMASERRVKADGRMTSSVRMLLFPEDARVEPLAVNHDGDTTDFILHLPWTSSVGTDPRRPRCTGRRLDGGPCRREPKRGTDRCSHHRDDDPVGGSSATPPPIAEAMGTRSSATGRGSSGYGEGYLSYPDVDLEVVPDVFQEVLSSDEAVTPLRDRPGDVDQVDLDQVDGKLRAKLIEAARVEYAERFGADLAAEATAQQLTPIARRLATEVAS